MTRIAAIVGFFCALAVVAGHVIALRLTNGNVIVEPISLLSRGAGGAWHSAGLVAFALAHVAVAYALGGIDTGWLWRMGRALLVVAGLCIAGIAVYFATADLAHLAGPNANDPLSVVASVVGVAMGALQRGWARRLRAMAVVNALCLTVWLLLIPLIVLVTDAWLGGYERIVGITYVIWIGALALAAESVARPLKGPGGRGPVA